VFQKSIAAGSLGVRLSAIAGLLSADRDIRSSASVPHSAGSQLPNRCRRSSKIVRADAFSATTAARGRTGPAAARRSGLAWSSPRQDATLEAVAPRSSNPSSVPPGDARRARVLPQIDRAQRLAAMLDRWEREEIVDEPDWDVDDIEGLALRTQPK